MNHCRTCGRSGTEGRGAVYQFLVPARTILRFATRLAGTLLLVSMGVGCASNPAPRLLAGAPGCRSAISAATGERAPLEWIVAADEADRSSLDEWCAAVGPAVIASRVDAPAGPVDSILVITWNSHVGGGDVPGLVADVRRGAHTGGRPVEHFVLLLQEAHRVGEVPATLPAGARHARRVTPTPDTGARVDVVNASWLLGLDLLYVPGIRTGGESRDTPEDRGTAILSTLPLHDRKAIELPYERHRRVVAMAAVRAASADGAPWALHVASVHLDNRSRPTRPLATFGGARLRQAMALEAAVPDSASVVLGGDMNSWSFNALEEAPRFLHRHFPDASFEGEATFRAGWFVHRRLDYIFFRLTRGSATTPFTIRERYGSDHQPVLSWVRFKPDG